MRNQTQLPEEKLLSIVSLLAYSANIHKGIEGTSFHINVGSVTVAVLRCEYFSGIQELHSFYSEFLFRLCRNISRAFAMLNSGFLLIEYCDNRTTEKRIMWKSMRYMYKELNIYFQKILILNNIHKNLWFPSRFLVNVSKSLILITLLQSVRINFV